MSVSGDLARIRMSREREHYANLMERYPPAEREPVLAGMKTMDRQQRDYALALMASWRAGSISDMLRAIKRAQEQRPTRGFVWVLPSAEEIRQAVLDNGLALPDAMPEPTRNADVAARRFRLPGQEQSGSTAAGVAAQSTAMPDRMANVSVT
jgi:hypothetical protein